MNVAVRTPRMTREQFLDWVQTQRERFEFDGFQPVAMVGGTNDHSRITLSIHRALHARLKGSGCEPLGPDAGVATVGDGVRYPDALVTCTKTAGKDRLVQGVVVVFEVLSPSSGLTGRIVKPREYAAVGSIRRYVIVESDAAALTVLSRAAGTDAWTATTLTSDDTLRLDELGIEVPVAEFYEGVELPPADAGATR